MEVGGILTACGLKARGVPDSRVFRFGVDSRTPLTAALGTMPRATYLTSARAAIRPNLCSVAVVERRAVAYVITGMKYVTANIQ